MNKEKIMKSDPFPRMEFFPRVCRVAHFLLDHIRSEGLSDHNSGGGPMLDRKLYDRPEQMQIDFEYQSNNGW